MGKRDQSKHVLNYLFKLIIENFFLKKDIRVDAVHKGTYHVTRCNRGGGHDASRLARVSTSCRVVVRSPSIPLVRPGPSTEALVPNHDTCEPPFRPIRCFPSNAKYPNCVEIAKPTRYPARQNGRK